MKVNKAKTTMVCVSGAQSYTARSHILTADGDRVESGESMKVLGFHLSNKANVHAHIDVLCKRLRQKYWVLYHFKKAGFDQNELAKVYRTCLLPFLDYCAIVYHPLLTDEQDQRVERLQSGALHCIYGFQMSYSKMREMAGVSTLRERRVAACDRFAKKCLSSGRFSSWFPLKLSLIHI